MSGSTNVEVALRIRPQSAQERIDQSSVVTFCPPEEPQIVFGDKKVFTFDFVFDVETMQSTFYSVAVQKLIKGTFEGYNATILAYGQTGSGKTYTMGSGFDVAILPDCEGVIPRAVKEIFSTIRILQEEASACGKPPPSFEVHVQFLELYNEEIIDLFEMTKQNVERKPKIHEDCNGNIYITEVTTRMVTSENETLGYLKDGALCRRTGSTNMNAQSSRSHAIFTLHMTQTRPLMLSDAVGEQSQEYEVLHTKLHFVDLAGSERLKRTGATGDRAKEGISINSGLLALGNVISALGDKSRKISHIPYRDSKLTRLLQDSLGGNSRTLMVACISPSDRDFMESLSTLKYANRARNIQNKAVVNQDRTSQQLSALRAQIQKLEVELAEYRQGKIVVGADGNVVLNDMSEENTMLRAENDNLRRRLKAQHEVIGTQSARLAQMQTSMEQGASIQDYTTGQRVSPVEYKSVDTECSSEMADVVLQYLKQIEDLKAQVCISESLATQMPKSPFRRPPSSVVSFTSKSDHVVRLPSADIVEETTEDILKVAKDDLSRLKLKEHRKRSSSEDMTESALVQTPKKNKWSTRSGSSEAETVCFSMEIGESSNLEDNSSEFEISEDTAVEDVFSSDEDVGDNDENNSDDDKISLQSDLATLSSEINIKQKLIDQLEKSQKTVYLMKLQYEEKMKSLQDKINVTENQRDQMLKEAGKNNLGSKKEQEIRQQYQDKLIRMENELKQLKASLKQHQHVVKSKVKSDAELRHLKTSVEDLKRQKVNLMRKMREGSQQKKLDELLKQREIAQLKKEDRRKENMIKELKADKLRKDVVLKRRQEEVAALRRVQRQRPVRQTAAVSSSSSLSKQRGSSIFSSENARKKWHTIEKSLTETILSRHTLINMEAEMDHWIKKRQELSERIQTVTNSLIMSQQDCLPLEGLRDELETLKDNLDYVQDRIKSGQNDIMALMETKTDEGDTTQVSTLIHGCTVREAKYLLEHFVDTVVKIGLEGQQAQHRVQELLARLQASQQETELFQTLVSPSLASSSSLPIESVESSSNTSAANQSTVKSRRRSATPQELTMTRSKRKLNSRQISLSLESLSEESLDSTLISTSCPPGSWTDCSVESMEVSDSTDGFERKSENLSHQNFPRLSKRDDTPQNSPLLSSRLAHQSSSSNVFFRLTTSNPSSSEGNSSKGQVKKLKFSGRNKLLVCTHSAEGHTNCVLSVYATNQLLFSASQDCTARIWDLEHSTVLATLPKHPSYVRKVLYTEDNNLLFTAFQAQIKVWDLRASLQAPVKVINSDSSTAVQDMVVHKHGPTLFFTAGSAINMWNLRMMTLEGKLSNNMAPVQSLTLDNQYLAAGSRDRNVRIYKFDDTTDATKLAMDYGNVVTLHPPHYDAVTCLTLYQTKLFSACNKTLKQWSMEPQNPVIMQTNDSAHQTTITGLAVMNKYPFLISSCKNGYMKCWNTETLSLTANVNARHSISCLATNNHLVFTGSSDKTIKIWAVNSS
ncbi:kinesin-like protein KIF21A isoform X2 [Dysidea avara]|uniref:kinesin-like protein KIF21A isoform X2 n=1 Tax=Dysidea avara TaxID=196820 RepID=UPI00332E6BD2